MSEKKTQENFLPICVFQKGEKTKIWEEQALQRRTSDVFGSERPWVVTKKECLEELDETGPEKRRKARSYKCLEVEQNYWIMDAARNFHSERIALDVDVKQWDKLRERTSLQLFEAWFTVCKMSGEYEVIFI